MSNLLLGNGINMCLKIEGLQEDEIAKRFFENLIRSSCLFHLLFGIEFNENICKELSKKIDKKGIESLTYFVYDYVIENMKIAKSVNTYMRLLDAIICCAITAIFYEQNKRLGVNYQEKNLPNMKRYDKIFTLNYVEYWDKENRCIYLHGHYESDKVICNNKPLLHYSCERYVGYDGYKELVQELNKKYNMCELYTRPIIFSPEFYKKAEMNSLGAYPSERLQPATDLFPFDMPKLYSELDNINNLEIFGMSPYGDDDLIKRLNTMKKIIVYVYDKEHSEQTAIWDKVLSCPHEIKDSSEI